MTDSRFYVPTDSAEDWRRFLAEPDKQWVPGYSAHALASAWEGARGFPERVRAALDGSGIPGLAGLELVLGLPEHKTPLPGGTRASQTDLLVLARNDSGLVAIAVEGKAEEPFGPTVAEWRSGSPGKEARLAFLCDALGLDVEQSDGLRYQLLHRTTAALLEAARLHAGSALMLVHSFSPAQSWFDDYSAFAAAMGASVTPDSVSSVGERMGRQLHLGWVSDPAQEA